MKKKHQHNGCGNYALQNKQQQHQLRCTHAPESNDICTHCEAQHNSSKTSTLQSMCHSTHKGLCALALISSERQATQLGSSAACSTSVMAGTNLQHSTCQCLCHLDQVKPTFPHAVPTVANSPCRTRATAQNRSRGVHPTAQTAGGSFLAAAVEVAEAAGKSNAAKRQRHRQTSRTKHVHFTPDVSTMTLLAGGSSIQRAQEQTAASQRQRQSMVSII